MSSTKFMFFRLISQPRLLSWLMISRHVLTSSLQLLHQCSQNFILRQETYTHIPYQGVLKGPLGHIAILPICP